jgi:DNA-binding NtrC family response regulator
VDVDSVVETSLRRALPANEVGCFLALATIHPPALGEQPLQQFPAILGRASGSSLQLDHESVSREHGVIEEERGRLWVTDLASKNGTQVNRVRLREGRAALQVGDILRLGDVVLRLVSRPHDLETTPATESPLVGGPSLHEVRRLIRLLGPTSLRIMVLGGSGTGKELVARELHRHSGRSGPFIALNCAALPESLVETELFGHVKGSFTGAVRDKPGLFEAARGGTLFLDEVTELPAATQAKLLRVVETGELRRVGAVSSVSTDCRILAATNHDLARDVEQGRFRGDLAARLAESEILLPALADRVEDLPLLVAHLSSRAGYRLAFDVEAMEILACYGWPLNVRELDNLVRTVGVLARGEVATAALLPQSYLAGRTQRGAAVSELDRVVAALRRNRGNIRRTSQEIGVSRTYIYRCLDRSGLDPRLLRSGTAGANGGGELNRRGRR